MIYIILNITLNTYNLFDEIAKPTKTSSNHIIQRSNHFGIGGFAGIR